VLLTSLNNSALGVISGVRNAAGAFTAPNTWTRQRISLAKPTPGGTSFPGPTGIVVKYADNGPNDPGDRVYVLNRFDNQIDVYDPVPATPAFVATTNLQNVVTPQYIQTGRRFLYSAEVGRISNGRGACYSCHFDGRTDELSWDLSETAGPFPGFSLELVSTLEQQFAPQWLTAQTFAFSQPKGEFITQSLQGLVNFEVEDPAAQFDWFSNAPYHWDLDMANLATFGQGGFQNLLGGTGLSPQLGEMDHFIKFVHSIHYPPNYEQPKQRYYTGVLGNLDEDTDSMGAPDGSGSLYGLKIYHTRPANHFPCFMRSCVQCHSLPEGSNNLATDPLQATRAASRSWLPNPTAPLPIETAALRGLQQKEAMYLGTEVPNVIPIQGVLPRYLVPPGGYQSAGLGWWSANGAPIYGSQVHFDSTVLGQATGSVRRPVNGLFHDGLSLNINDFLVVFDTGAPLPPPHYTNIRLAAVSEFVRQFDTGVAPMVGHSLVVDSSGITVNTNIANPTGIRGTGAGRTSRIADLMEQVRVVNCGLAVTGRLFGTDVGFFYVPNTGGQPGVFISMLTASVFTSPQLLGFVGQTAGDVLVFTATPLGMERLIATPGTSIPAMGGPAPSNLQIETMVPMTAYEIVPSFQKNVDPLDNRSTVFSGPMAFGFNGPDHTPWQEKSFRILQAGFKNSIGSPQNPSTVVLNHEPPRRFRVSGNDIRPGAVLCLHIPTTAPNGPNPDWKMIELPLYPSDKVDNGRRIWETAVEADNVMAGVFANGGWWSPGIDQKKALSPTSVLTRKNTVVGNPPTYGPWNQLNTINIFKRAVWNNYRIEVVNEDGTRSGLFTNQAINIEPPGFAR